MLPRTARASCRRDSWPALYEARAKWKADEPSISVLSRSKNAALRCVAGLAAVDLEDDRVALAATRADGRDAKAAAAPAQLVHESAEHTRAGCANRVTERNRPAVHVDLRLVEAEHAHRVERDRREGLVELEQVDVVDRQSGLLERRLGGVRGGPSEIREVVGHGGL